MAVLEAWPRRFIAYAKVDPGRAPAARSAVALLEAAAVPLPSQRDAHEPVAVRAPVVKHSVEPAVVPAPASKQAEDVGGQEAPDRWRPARVVLFGPAVLAKVVRMKTVSEPFRATVARFAAATPLLVWHGPIDRPHETVALRAR